MLSFARQFSKILGAGASLGVAFTASTSQAAVTTFEWDQNLGHVTVMKSTSQGMCFLTGMEGDYQGAGENIHIENDDNYWVLNGSSGQNSVTGWATCVNWSDFAGNAGYGWDTWSISSNCIAGRTDNWPFANIPAVTFEGTATLWNQYNFCSLSQIGGGLDLNTSTQAYFDGTNWQFYAWEAQGDATMNEKAVCMGLKLNHPMGFTGLYTWTVGQGPVAMIPANEGVCAITRVNGAFRGNGEIAQIENIDGTWVMWGASKQSNTSIGAQCVYFNQR